MPTKWDEHRTAGEKLLGLYSLPVFIKKAYSLIRLAETLTCSRQTVLRPIEQIKRSNQIGLESWTEDGQAHNRARPAKRAVNASLDPEAIRYRRICTLRHRSPHKPEPFRHDHRAVRARGLS